MENQKNNKGIIALLIVIIVILAVLCVLFATGTISFKSNKVDNDDNTVENIDDVVEDNYVSSDDSINNDKVNDNEEISIDDREEYSRDDIILKLKNALSDDEWIKNNLYSKENCFGDEVSTENQNLTFLVLSDENNNPIIIVKNYTEDEFLNTCYKVYFEDGNVLVKNIIGRLAHPSHEGFSVDMEKGLVISTYMHMGSHIVTSYDVKKDVIEKNELYSCTTGKCDYLYEYDGNLTDISLELNKDNIDKYVK